MAQDTQDPQFRIRIRFFRSEGLGKWQVFQIAAALPLLLQLALLLFFIGLSEYLRELNPVVGWATTGPILAWLAVFVFTTLAPILSSQCPYRTPILKQPLQYIRRTTQSVYGFIKQYLIGSIWLFITSLPALGKQAFLSQIHPLYKAVYGRCIPFIEQSKYFLYPLLTQAKGVSIRCERWIAGNGGLGDRLRFVSMAPISLLLLLTFLISYAYKEINRVVRRRWPDTSRWQYIPLPEESTVREDETNDQEILIYSGPFFLDQKLNQTIRECIKPVTASQIVSDFAVGRLASTTSSGWKVNVGLGTKRGTNDMVREIALHMAESEPKDPTWFAALDIILEAGITGPYWSDLPTLIIQLTRSDLEHGAAAAFVAMYSSLAQSGGLTGDLGKLLEESRGQGDQQCT